MLAEMAGHDEEDFARSITPEVSPALTVHDITLWNPLNLFSEYSEEEQAEMLSADDWLRFTIVRHPATRLWSAWQSKLLLREPRFVQTFGEEPWFPELPSTPETIVRDFRVLRRGRRRGRGRGRPLGGPARARAPAALHAHRPRRAHGGDARRAARARRRGALAVPHTRREPHAAVAAARRVRRGRRGGPARALRRRLRDVRLRAGGVPRRRRGRAGGLGGEGLAAAADPALPRRRQRPRRAAARSRAQAAQARRVRRGGVHREGPAAHRRHPRARDEEPREQRRVQRALGLGRPRPHPRLHRRAAAQERGAHAARTRCRRCCGPCRRS